MDNGLKHSPNLGKEVLHLLLYQLQVRITGAPFVHLHCQFLNLLVLLRHNTLVFVSFLHQVTNEHDVLAYLFFLVLLVSHEVENAPLVVFGLAGEELFLRV